MAGVVKNGAQFVAH